MHGRWLTATVVSLTTLVTSRVMAQGAAAAQDAGPTVMEAAVGTGVADRQLQGAGESFPATVGNVFCLIKVGKTQSGAQIELVWYHSNTEVGRKQLTMGGSPWRTWGSKVIPPDATGDWRVDVVADGKVLKSVAFKVQ